ncbi:MAG: hypothetical protein Q9M37_07660 [Desulfonauticus sp.]|nr:hypothetical protein [Desulfonauticus sp.]
MKKFLLFSLIIGLFGVDFGWAKPLRVTIYGPAESKIYVFVAEPINLDGKKNSIMVQEVVQCIKVKLKLFPFFKQLSPKDILEQGKINDVARIDYKKFFLSRADIVITIGERYLPDTGKTRIELRTFDVFKQKMILGKAFDLTNQRQVVLMVRKYLGDLLQLIMGNKAFFVNPIVFVHKGIKKSSIYQIFADGFGLKKLADIQGIVLSPSWSFDGEKIVFSVIQHEQHKLGILDLKTGNMQFKKLPGNSCISPVFTPWGDIAVSLDFSGSPDIYLLDKQLKIEKALVKHWGIDISPCFDQSGSKMVFTSSRLGNPHIFLFNLHNNQVERITYEGNYNTSAVISPDGRLIVFSRLTPEGHRIFVHDLKTGQEKQITFGPGNDEEPFVSSDGYFVVFTSNRSGKYKLYYTTINGDGPYLIPTNNISTFSPSWSWVEEKYF